ncbi:MAG: hypothetical protein H6644_20825 [Caldilineaceae bacterium]|nr:hypothetical protein [Caldilineaceae bacterium]
MAAVTASTPRFLSVWWSVLAVALLAGLARALRLAPMSGLLATLLLALAPYAIWHAQDARMYSMSLALTTASTLCMAGWLARRRWPWAAGYVLVTLLALHVHYFAAFVVVAQYLFVMGQAILDRRYRWSLLPWLGMQAAVALLYVPWLIVAAATLTGRRQRHVAGRVAGAARGGGRVRRGHDLHGKAPALLDRGGVAAADRHVASGARG